jgi:hypothetical protein
MDDPGVPLPGAKMPPLLTVVVPTVPVPARVPPLFTVTVELAIVPVTFRVPMLTVHGKAATFVPIKVQTLLPVF